MKVAVLGAGGMLGHDVVSALARAGADCVALGREDCDLLDADRLIAAVPACDWVINCAAYTDVDGAETHPEQAARVNTEGAAQVAALCARRGVRLLHVSTDYVFDGRKGAPYCEEDTVHPLGVYAASKLDGERRVGASGAAHVIVRTQALFGKHGRNFVRTIAERMLRGSDPLRVVDDQWVCPTYTAHLAEAILRLLPLEREGIVHVSAEGACTWFELAEAVARHVRPGHPIHAVSSAEYTVAAERPRYSVLDTSRYREWTGTGVPEWPAGLAEYVSEMRWGGRGPL